MKRECLKCRSKLKYSEKYDAYYCEKCNEWTEKKCESPDCEYCKNRPDKPNKSKEDKILALIYITVILLMTVFWVISIT